ncbi:MAG: sodium:solute symporter family protein [Arcobacter sp.]|jgi:cation/acetate symporter|uniref:sodium:solute symporter family protein n=1 Tax=unclassified Arcobacter TaxID=2593671 RepID=UPI0002296387|nr:MULTISPECIES: sodium:solute symporter family protein [unclassified Arcobacter]MDY3199599.1 sodium:solute symporter family protein [Arcobacter sp.]BAK72518.1 sodium-solute symporter [Arcobacter sp. L]
MELQTLIYLFVGISFAIYIGIALWAKAGSTKDFYVAGGGVHPVANGMATAADWMSAASFISMAGIIAFKGSDASAYLMGWTGGYVLLAMLLAPYLRKFGKFTVPDFVGDRYYSDVARLVAVIGVIFVSFTYVAGQMRGVGIVFSRFLQVDVNTGVMIGMAIVFFYSVLGGMKGITYTQVAQYVVMIFAYTIPAIFLSLQVTDTFLPQLGIFGQTTVAFNDGVKIIPEGTYLLHALDSAISDLGFGNYTEPTNLWNMFMLTTALMLGTAGLPHVIVRFFTVPTVKDARVSAGWALVFIAIMYTSASAVAAFSRVNLIKNVQNVEYSAFVNGEAKHADGTPNHGKWFQTWEQGGLLAWNDRNGDGKIQYASGPAFDGKGGKPVFDGDKRAEDGHKLTTNAKGAPDEAELAKGNGIANELYVDNDIMVLANPEIANLPNWVIALIAAGGLAAALSTAAGLLLVIASAISHDLMGQVIFKDKITGKSTLNEKTELMWARISAIVAIVIAGYLGINPPGFVAQVVAFAFGLAAAAFFPTIILGVFDKRMNKEGAIAGILVGLFFTFGYIVYFVFMGGKPENYLFGINPTGIGTIGTLLHLIVAIVVSRMTPPPPQEIQDLVERIRIPSGAGQALDH